MVPFIALTKEDAFIESLNDQMTQLLKNPSINSETKMALFHDMMAKIKSFSDELSNKKTPTIVVTSTENAEPVETPKPHPVKTPPKQRKTSEKKTERVLENEERPPPEVPKPSPRKSPKQLKREMKKKESAQGDMQVAVRQQSFLERMSKPKHQLPPVRRQVGNGRIYKRRW